MKRSEIKDLYNQSDSALRLLKVTASLLPYCNGVQATAEATQTAAAQAANLWNPVKVMCDYMIDDGSIDMTERLQNIKAEVSQIELSVAKMGYSKEQMPLLLNCRAIINQIKDMEAWTTDNPEPQQKHTEAPQQPIGGISGELAGNDKKTHKEHTKKTFKDRIAGNVDSDALIAKLHTLMDSKKGKDALIYLAVCIKDGKLISLPTYKETTKIFPNIGCRAGYYKYTVSTKLIAPKVRATAKTGADYHTRPDSQKQIIVIAHGNEFATGSRPCNDKHYQHYKSSADS